jgi:nicotinic acid mononucleotide adenylyltransferase
MIMKFAKFLKRLNEEKEVVIASFGRMNPISKGHEKLVEKMKSIAQQHKGDVRLYLSHSHDPKKNPLDYDEKIYFAKKAFGDIVHHSPANDIVKVLKDINQYYSNVIFVVGGDRISDISKLAEKYNGKEYNFDSIKVVSAGERDPDAEGVTGISGSKMRKFAQEGDFESFAQGAPSKLGQSDVRKMFELIKGNMK